MISKKVINGLMFNIETADELAGHSYSNRRDFRFFSETLYRTKKGNYFLLAEGGPASKYAIQCGQNETCGSSDILSLTDIEAFDWCQENNIMSVIEKYFSDKVQEA